MRIVTFAFLFLIVSASVHANAADLSSSEGISKVELVQELAMGKARKLLGWNGDNYFFAKQDGSVSVMGKDGKTLFTLQAKDGKGELVLKKPEAVAVSDGVIYVADSETNHVAMFTLQGKFEGSFGDRSGGGFFGGSGGLNSPHGIAVFDGVVYVTETSTGKIQLFGSNGVSLGVLEIDSAPENSAAKEKKLPYKLDEPTDIAINAMGQIYVLDADDSLIKVYSPNGAYLNHLPEGFNPQAFSIAHDGIYVADRDSLVIQKYDFNGNQMYSFGSKGKGRAQFKSISGLAAGAGQVIVGDSEKGVVDVFKVESEAPVESSANRPSRISVRWEQAIPVPVGKIAWDGKGTIYGIDAGDKKNNEIVRIENGVVTGEIKLNDIVPVSVAIDKKGILWVLDKEKDRVVSLDESGNILTSFGTSGSHKGEFDDFSDIAISSTGVIFVVDNGNRRVQAFSSDGVFLKEIRSDSSGKLEDPVAVAIDPQDGFYVLDKGRSVVSIYSAKGEALGVFGNQAGATIFAKPVAVMATHDEVFVLDSGKVEVFSHKGQYIRSFASNGKAPGQFDEPLSIAATGNTTFGISEHGSKRLQTFATLYKPAAPEQLAAQGAVHAVELHWAASSAPYIKQYRIYRSESENSGFAEIATSNTNQYTDRGMDGEKKYYYRVAAETGYGYVGPKSDVADGVTRKYIPAALENVEAVPSSWQLKMTWKPVDQQYFSAYLIYQKDKDAFTKIGETTLPEFIKDSLTPDTKYTYYVSVRGTDGIESDKFAVTATTLPFNEAPLEIEVIKFRDIFSNTYKLYEQDGVGRIKLTNNTDKAIENIKVSLMLNNFMDFPTEGKIDKLLPGQSEEVTLKAVFNNNILTVTEDSSIQALIEASYFQDGKRIAFSKNPTVTVYDKHRMTWDEHDRFASFVTPKDSPIINFARSVATQFNETKDESQLAAVLFDAMGVIGFTYIQNPIDPYQVSIAKTATTEKTDTIDYVQYPRETLERKSGDCVDLVAFYATTLESMGITTLMLEVPDHLLMMFSTGIDADADGYTMDDMYVIHDGKLWIPVETTIVGKPFIKAWELGAANYYKWKDKGLSLLDVHDSWNTYKPATLPDSSFKVTGITSGQIDEKFPGDFSSMLKISSQTKTRRYLQAIEKNPDDMDAHLQIGIILAKIGAREEAMKYFDKVLDAEPKNAAALNNRGNLFMLDKKYPEAQKAYLAATQAGPDDPYVWINLAKSYKAVNETKKAKAAFVKAQRLDPSVKEKYKAMALELLNTL